MQPLGRAAPRRARLEFRPMSVGKTLALLAALLCAQPGAVFAQYRTVSASLSAESALRKLGLQRAWQTQLEFDAARGKLAGVTQHISARTAQTIYEVTYPGGRKT